MSLKNAKIAEHKDLTHDVFEIRFETEDNIDFKSGQFVTIKINDKLPPCFRAYSIASSPIKNSKEFKLCIKRVENGRGSNWLNNLKVNETINFIGPNGHFTHKGEKPNSFFIATGTGLAPFTAMIEDLINQGSDRNLELLFGVRHIKDVFYQEWLSELAKKGDFKFTTTLSRPEDENWKGSVGRVTNILREKELDTKNTEFYICGLNNMIEEIVEILKEKGVPEESIHFEKYD